MRPGAAMLAGCFLGLMAPGRVLSQGYAPAVAPGKMQVADGLRLASGETLRADIVVVATGLKLNLLGDIALSVDGRPRRASEAMVYKGMMLSDVPNMMFIFGYTNASWTLKADLSSEYLVRLLRRMDAAGKRVAIARRDRPIATNVRGLRWRGLRWRGCDSRPDTSPPRP